MKYQIGDFRFGILDLGFWGLGSESGLTDQVLSGKALTVDLTA
jgi:hypothetical protein